jgi:glutathione synthase
VILESVTHAGTRNVMVQKYLREIVNAGDKRIILIDGQPIPASLVRIPSPGDHRGNLAAGARAEIRPLTERDRWICEQVGPVLRDHGLLFAGIDIIGEYLTEINVTSPTGIRELERGGQFHVTRRLLDAIESRLDCRSIGVE